MYIGAPPPAKYGGVSPLCHAAMQQKNNALPPKKIKKS
jgi:hypothetical protein